MANDDEPKSQAWTEDLRNAIAELDARSVPDQDYRNLLSTGAKTPLKPGESWRSRALRFAGSPATRRSKEPLSNAERQRLFIARLKARAEGTPPPATAAKGRQPTRPQRWAAAIDTLDALLDEYQDWRDRLPESLGNTGMAEQLDELLTLREQLAELRAATLPKGFGRD